MTMHWSLRGRLLASVLLTLGLVLVLLTAGFNLVLVNRLSHAASSVASARAAAELAGLQVRQGRIQLPETPDKGTPDAVVWVLQGRQVIESPQTGSVPRPVLIELAARAPAARDLTHPSLRLRALPVEDQARRVGAVVAGVSLAAYHQTRATALIASTILAVLALLAAGLAFHWLIGRALRPVATMTHQAADWSEHDLDRRFGLGPPIDEFTELAAVLDDLLERLAASLRHEQRLSAELSHELRTPLAGVQAQAQYALRHTSQDSQGRQALEEILTATRRMTTTLDTLIAAARAELDPHGTSSDARAAASAAVASAAPLAGTHGVGIELVVDDEAVSVAVEQRLLERILAPLIENACRYAETRVAVQAAAAGSRARILVTDDGPGIPVEQLEAVFEPGWQGEERADGTLTVKGAGLGLSLARRLARSAGGDVRAEPSHPGARFVVELPGSHR